MSKLTLAINTASSETAIALLEDDKILDEKSWRSENNEAEKLMPAIAKFFKKKKIEEISRVIVVKGPGSFTGLRVGVTVANTIAYLDKCELFGIDTCEYLWAAVDDKSLKEKGLALIIFAGSKGVYISRPEAKNSQGGGSAKDADLVNLPDLKKYLEDHKIAKLFGDVSKEQRKILEEFDSTEFIETKISFGEIIQKIIAGIHEGKFLPAQIVEPIYVKKPAITESKKSIFT